jgi:hypothetical protein
MKSKNALEDEHVRGVDRCGLVQARVLLEGVDRDLSLFARETVSRVSWMRLKNNTHPSLMSLSFSTKTSKSIASGESKSYSFLCAAAI